MTHVASVLGKISVLLIVAAHLGGCAGFVYAPKTAVRTGTVRTSTLKKMEALNMDRTAPVLIRIYKEESTLEVWKQNRMGKFALLNSYPICKFSGTLGPKLVQGDHQAPEGFYDITPSQMNLIRASISRLILGFLMPMIALLGEPEAFLWCTVAVDPSVVMQ